MNSNQVSINDLNIFINQIFDKCIDKHIWLYSRDTSTGIPNASFIALGLALLKNN